MTASSILSLLPNNATTSLPDTTLTVLQDDPKHVGVSIEFRRAPALMIPEAQVYNASLQILLQAAQIPDIGSSIWPGLATYNAVYDFTMKFYPSSYIVRDRLDVETTALAISYMADAMVSHAEVGAYPEFDGEIIVDRNQVGQFYALKGDSTGELRCVDSEDKGGGVGMA